MAIDFVELAANFDKRFPIVLGKANDHGIQPPERSTKRNLELFITVGVFFGVRELRIEFFFARLRLVKILFQDVECLGRLLIRKSGFCILELRIAEGQQQFRFANGVCFADIFGPPLLCGAIFLRCKRSNDDREAKSKRRKLSE